ncbi:unnamed protein product [Rotaria socialis]
MGIYSVRIRPPESLTWAQVEHPAPNNNTNIIVHQPSSIRPHHSPSPPTLNSSTSSNNTKVRLARNPVLSIQHPKTSTPCQQKSSFHNPKFNHPPPPISSSPPTPRTSSIAPTTAAIVIMKTLCLFYHFHDIFLFNCTNSLNE